VRDVSRDRLHAHPRSDHEDVGGTPLEPGIGREKCHGPGSLHVEANQDPARKDPGKIKR